MAYIRERTRADGGITFTVLWRAGGAATGKQDSEIFSDSTLAERFKHLVDGHGQQWPPGWVRRKGFVVEEPAPEIDPAHLFEAYALAYVDLLTGVQGDTKTKYRKLIRGNMVPWFRDLTVPDGPQAISSEAIKRWVNDLEAGRPAPHDPPGTKRTKYRAKTIRDNHGLLSGILQSAVVKDPQQRRTNPCVQTRLPRADDGDHEEMTFLEHWEFGLILKHLAADAVDLVELMAGTGMRWGEITALQPRDRTRRGGRPAVMVQRTWRFDEEGARVTGPPKTKKSRRTLVLTDRLAEIVGRAAAGKPQDGLLFTAPEGGAWQPATFRRDRWLPGIALARQEGLTKVPRIHDVRHTHAAWLIARTVPLPAIQARLGHESIQTTVDRYGHLLAILDEDVVAAVDFALDAAHTPVIPPDVLAERAALATAA